MLQPHPLFGLHPDGTCILGGPLVFVRFQERAHFLPVVVFQPLSCLSHLACPFPCLHSILQAIQYSPSGLHNPDDPLKSSISPQHFYIHVEAASDPCVGCSLPLHLIHVKHSLSSYLLNPLEACCVHLQGYPLKLTAGLFPSWLPTAASGVQLCEPSCYSCLQRSQKLYSVSSRLVRMPERRRAR